MDIHALRKRGWTISAIARHVGRGRKTVRAYLDGKRQVGKRAPAAQDSFTRFVDYCSARLTEDPHLWATALFDEVVKLGYERSYPSFTRALRLRGLRPECEPCHPTKGRPAAVIEHPAGEETQWDWVELPDPPPGWDGYRKKAFLLVGTLSHSSKLRGVLCESMQQPQLAEAQHQVAITSTNGQLTVAAYCPDETGILRLHTVQVPTVATAGLTHNVVFADPQVLGCFDLPQVL